MTKIVEHVIENEEGRPAFTVVWTPVGSPCGNPTYEVYQVAHDGYNGKKEIHYMPAERAVPDDCGFVNNYQEAEMYMQGTLRYDGRLFIDMIENCLYGAVAIERHYALLKYILETGLAFHEKNKA